MMAVLLTYQHLFASLAFAIAAAIDIRAGMMTLAVFGRPGACHMLATIDPKH